MPRLTIAVLASVVGFCACSQPLSEPDCDALLNHYTERLLREERPEITNIELAKKQEAARRLVRVAPRFEFARCAELVSRKQLECALGAPSVDSIERCLM